MLFRSGQPRALCPGFWQLEHRRTLTPAPMWVLLECRGSARGGWAVMAASMMKIYATETRERSNKGAKETKVWITVLRED